MTKLLVKCRVRSNRAGTQGKEPKNVKGRGDLTTFATGLSKGDVREKVRQWETFTNHLFQSYLLYRQILVC